MTTKLSVAKTILGQLGGHRFIAMTGASQFVGGPDWLSMRLRKNKSWANHLKITLDANDTYTMDFYKWSRKQLMPWSYKEISGVYAEDLQKLFTAVTGFDTSL